MSIPLRVRHLLAAKTNSLHDFILSQVDISSKYYFELLDLGSIYLNHKRCRQEQVLSPGDYVRIHLSPKRFPQITFFSETVLCWEKDFVIFNKPQGFPCHPLVDNSQEDLLSQAEKFFGEKFFLTHRLDIGTGGLWLVARNAEFQKFFNQQLQEKKVKKKYRARVEGAWSLGTELFTHYMKPSLRAPREVFNDAQDGYAQCLLQVEEFQSSSSESELLLQLLTGRTHQIRAQMSFLGHPVVGDTLYGAKPLDTELESWHLWAQELSFESSAGIQNFKLSSDQMT